MNIGEPMYDSLYWSKDLDLKAIRRYLRIYGKGYTSEKIVDAWTEKNGVIGVPRQWAMDRDFPGKDNTIYPKKKWPKFKGGYRYNQEECCDRIETALREKYGALLESPTGWGKTVAALNIASRFHTPTLVMVHKQDLVPQWRETAKKFFGVSCGLIQQDTWDFNHQVTIAMIQTLKARKLSKEVIQKFGMVVVDEGQHVPCDTFVDVISQFPARYRLGVSATWRRSDQLQDLWKWHLGNIEAKGIRPILPAEFYQFPVDIHITDKEYTRHTRINHSAMISAIAENETFNAMIAREVAEARSKNRNVLVVSHRTKQLEILFDKIPNCGVYAGKFKGNTLKREDLERAARKKIILATYKKIEEGTDIPKLDTLILGTPCSDPEQVYGRVARDWPNKKTIVVVDPIVTTSYNYALAAKRKKVYLRLGIKEG